MKSKASWQWLSSLASCAAVQGGESTWLRQRCVPHATQQYASCATTQWKKRYQDTQTVKRHKGKNKNNNQIGVVVVALHQ